MSYTSNAQAFGTVVIRARVALGLTQSQLATKLKVAQAAVSGWESGTSLPRAALFPAISKALKIDVAELTVHLVARTRAIKAEQEPAALSA